MRLTFTQEFLGVGQTYTFVVLTVHVECVTCKVMIVHVREVNFQLPNHGRVQAWCMLDSNSGPQVMVHGANPWISKRSKRIWLLLITPQNWPYLRTKTENQQSPGSKL